MCYRGFHVVYTCGCESYTEKRNEFCILGDLCAMLEHCPIIWQTSKHLCRRCQESQAARAKEQEQEQAKGKEGDGGDDDDDDDGFTVVKRKGGRKQKKKTETMPRTVTPPERLPPACCYQEKERNALNEAAVHNLAILLRTRPPVKKRNMELLGYLLSLPGTIILRSSLVDLWVSSAVGREPVDRLEQAYFMADRRDLGHFYTYAWRRTEREIRRAEKDLLKWEKEKGRTDG